MDKPLLTFDHSQRSTWQACKRMYLFRHICGIRKATPEGAGFAFGSSFHASSEVLDITGDVALAMGTFISMFDFPDDKVRTLLRAKTMLESYQQYVKQQGWSFRQQEEGTMEIAFNQPLTPRINYAGRCDRQFVDGSIGEWKTTYYLYNSSGNPMPYLQQWWGHNSIRGYAWACGANKVHLLGVGVYPQKEGRGGKEYPCCAHLTIPITAWELEQFKYEAEVIGEEIIAACQKNGLGVGRDFGSNLEKVLDGKLHTAFPTNTSRCYFNVNNPCQFIDLCTRNVPAGLVEGNYVLDPFLPWLDEKDKD
jgi:hypothetical protein